MILGYFLQFTSSISVFTLPSHAGLFVIPSTYENHSGPKNPNICIFFAWNTYPYIASSNLSGVCSKVTFPNRPFLTTLNSPPAILVNLCHLFVLFLHRQFYFLRLNHTLFSHLPQWNIIPRKADTVSTTRHCIAIVLGKNQGPEQRHIEVA